MSWLTLLRSLVDTISCALAFILVESLAVCVVKLCLQVMLTMVEIVKKFYL